VRYIEGVFGGRKIFLEILENGLPKR